jgi:photosystem II stability/assembly factor-like uncharacterized protein
MKGILRRIGCSLATWSLMIYISLNPLLAEQRTQPRESEKSKGDAIKLEQPPRWELREVPTIPEGRLFKAQSQTWGFIGPAPMNSNIYANVSGRITSLAVDPTNANIVYAAAAGGGLWKSTDGGTTWFPLTDNFPRLSSGSVAIDPNNSTVVYYGTGEMNFNIDGYPGAGLFKSTDGGVTWSQLNLTSGALYYTSKIVVASNSTVYAAGYYDVYKSTDGGSTWTELHLSNGAVDDIVVDPTNPNVIYASYGSIWSRDSSSYGIHKSTDGGLTWSWLTTGLPPASQIGRVSLAIAPSAPQVLYAAINGNKPNTTTSQDTNRVYVSTNSGSSWSLLPSVTNTSDFGGNQGWYNNVVAVDPTNSNVVYLGGIDFWKSTDGGYSWTNLTNGYNSSYTGQRIHVDQHAIAFANGSGSVFYIGNDGGVWKTTNGATSFTNCNATLQTIQFYALDADQNNSGVTVGGTQDNGTESNDQPSTTWSEIYGGDGGYVLVDPKNSNIIYTEYVNGQIFKSTNGGSTFNPITSGIGESGYWLTPYVMDPQNDNVLYAGTSKIYKSTNAGKNWTALTANLKSPSDLLTTMSISPVEGNVLYAGISGYRGAADTAYLFVSTNSGASWTDITSKLPSGTNFARVTADPTHKGWAYLAVLVGNNSSISHVLKTTDYGATWTGIASTNNGFDNVPTKVVYVDSTDGYIYAGTYSGVYRSTDNGASWSKFGTGLPNAVVDDIAIQYSTHELRVATHGRGIWQISVLTGIAQLSDGPQFFALNQNYPNPFNPSTIISYRLPSNAFVTLKVYDVLGREIITLVNEDQTAGEHRVTLNANNLPSGVYFYRITAGNFVETKKMTLLR